MGVRLSDLPIVKYAEMYSWARQAFKSLCERVADELDLGYDVLEPSGWTIRRLPDGRAWASHPAGGNAELCGQEWKWHGDDMNWMKVP